MPFAQARASDRRFASLQNCRPCASTRACQSMSGCPACRSDLQEAAPTSAGGNGTRVSGHARRATPLNLNWPDGTGTVDAAPTLVHPDTLEVIHSPADSNTTQAPQQRPSRDIAVVNEWFERTGGAERVLLAVCSALPGAEAFVLWSDRDLTGYPQMRESWLARTPLRGHKALTLPLMPLIWRTQTRQRYDVVLSLSHSLNHTARLHVNPGGVHLSYVHTPARYLWLPEIDPRRTGPGQHLAVEALKRLELHSNRHVASYAANSQSVRQRIKKFWRREARVIHPPCRTAFFNQAPAAHRRQNRDYLLAYGRWVDYKRFDFVIDVAARAGLPLVIAGSGPMEAKLRSHAARVCTDVRFELRPDDARIRELIWGARALLYPCDEDFGIVPVEAQACGTPVIGMRRGGLLDTVVDGLTGYLIDGLDVDAYVDRIRTLANLERVMVRANADRFSETAFAERIRHWVDEISER
jgi:glycosyltransferase involved in cell wall biosynthesis